MTSLLVKYRPNSWDEVIGQDLVVDAMATAVAHQDIQTFLLYGPSGVGKTTLAKIAAREFKCENQDIYEIDAATYNGIEKMREVQQLCRFQPIGGDKRAIIIDEAHGLSRQAWDSLLKITEEPPQHIVWFFCTTNPNKVPKTLRTRCAVFQLNPVSDDDLLDVVNQVAKSEKIKLRDEVIRLIIREAQGSPRQALANLIVCKAANTRQEAAALLKTAIESDKTIELCRLLAGNNPTWPKVASALTKLKDENTEGVRIICMNYFGKCLLGAKNDREACHFLQRLEAFSQPYNYAEGLGPLMLSVGRIIFSEN